MYMKGGLIHINQSRCYTTLIQQRAKNLLIISIDAKKELDKIHPPFMIKSNKLNK